MMPLYKITNTGTNKCLNIHGNNVTALKNNSKITLWEDSDTNEQKWDISSLSGDIVIKSVINTDFGLNAHRSGSPYNCDVYPLSENEKDSIINLIPSAGAYKIKLKNYALYLTTDISANGANVFWAEDNGSKYQLWNITAIDNSIAAPVKNYAYPTEGRNVSQNYSSGHPAMDITGGGNIYAFADGVVAYTQESKASWKPNAPNPPYPDTSMETLGNCIVINHINPDKSKAAGAYARTVYAHLKAKPTLKKGDSVKAGDIIGIMGTTGRSSGDHLHFCLAVGDNAYLSPEAKSLGWQPQSSMPAINPRIYLSNYK